MDLQALQESDPSLAELVRAEEQRQKIGLELIPSENYVSAAVLEALGTVFTNKYSEGYPRKRYYGGQINTDQLEEIAIKRATKLFGADHANVQPHSGAQANEAAFYAWAAPGDTILAMDLSHGGHLTHGHPVTMLARIFKFVRYGMKSAETGEIDYDQLAALAEKHQPKIILAGFSSYPRELDYDKFAAIAADNGAVAMADMAHVIGLIAGGALANPLEAGFQVMSATTHKTLRGPRGGIILSRGTVSNPLKAVDKTTENLPTLIDRTVFPGIQGGPHMHTILAKAVALGEAAKPEFKTYAAQVIKNAKALADVLISRGFKLVTGGTDNHMILVDVYGSFKVSGGEAETALDAIGLTANKNVIPDDTRPPFDPSGLRLGTPAATTRGMEEKHMVQIAEWMLAAIKNRDDGKKLKRLHTEVIDFCEQFPLPGAS